MSKFYFSIVVLCLSILMGCGNSNSKQNANTEVYAENYGTKVALFSEIDHTIARLTLNGIGQLSAWQSDGMGEYISITPYYQFGGGISPNNLAYYLVSENINYIQRLQLTLNVNNNAEKKQALKKFSEIADKTFECLELEIPQGLSNATKEGKEFNFENENYIVSVVLDKSNIETYIMQIKSK